MKPTLFLLVGLFATSLALQAAPKSADLSDLPPAVRRTINQQTDLGPVKKVKQVRENGATLYEVEFKDRGEKNEMIIDSNGAILERDYSGKGKKKGIFKRDRDDDDDDDDDRNRVRRQTTTTTTEPVTKTTPAAPSIYKDSDDGMLVPLERLPEPVRKTIEAEKKRGRQLIEVRREMDGQVATFHAHYRHGIISYNNQGREVARSGEDTRKGSTEVQKIAWAAVPKPVQDAIIKEVTEEGRKVVDVRREIDGTKTVYHAYFPKGIFTYSPQGKLIGQRAR